MVTRPVQGRVVRRLSRHARARQWVSRCLPAGGVLLLLVGCSSGGPKSDRDPTGPAPTRFSFETGQDGTSEALRELHQTLVQAATTSEEAADFFRQRHEALATLNEDPEGAAERLVDDADRLAPDDENGFFTLMLLLGQFNSDAGANFLLARAQVEVPERDPALANICTEMDPPSMTRRLRVMGVAQLGLLAARGHTPSRAHLLSLVSEESDEEVRRAAIKATYDSNTQRWRVKRQMAQRLPSSQHHLLYETY